MNTLTQFVVGQKYTNDQIRYSLNLENLGGIRPSVGKRAQLQHLAVMTALETARKRKQENPYEDRIEGDVLLYTASGKEGDQKLEGKNKRLLEQYQSPVPFYGFANEGRQVYQFLGLLELLRHYQETQLDKSGSFRSVWIFEFLIHCQPDVVPIKQAQTISAELLAKSRANTSLLADDKTVVIAPLPQKDRERAVFLEAEQIRSALLTVNPYKFEHLLRNLVTQRGFRDVVVTKSSGDGGIDLSGYVPDNDDFFAGTFVQFQAKRWRHAVGSVEINNFRGALSSMAKGVFVTTSHFTKAAIEEGRHRDKASVTLVDGQRLARMIQSIELDLTPFLPCDAQQS
jgi:HJR/Mrr/RecB family endonuclease